MTNEQKILLQHSQKALGIAERDLERAQQNLKSAENTVGTLRCTVDALKGDDVVEDWHALPDFGCHVRLDEGAILTLPSDWDGGRMSDTPTEVTAPDSQSFLDAVNAVCGTSFVMSHFAGR